MGSFIILYNNMKIQNILILFIIVILLLRIDIYENYSIYCGIQINCPPLAPKKDCVCEKAKSFPSLFFGNS